MWTRGAGKSTLFAVLGLLEPPDAGRLVVDGTDASTCSERRRARLRRNVIGLAFQDAQLIPELTARENALAPQHHGDSSDEAWVDELLERFAVADCAGRYPAALSAGEKQWVAAVRAFANRPDVVVADQPTRQLDAETGTRVLELLLEAQASMDTALVVISHTPSLEDRFDHMVIEMQGGSPRL